MHQPFWTCIYCRKWCMLQPRSENKIKIPGNQKHNNLTDILKYQKAVMIQNCNIIHLMGIHQRFFVNQQIRNYRIQQIQQINQYKMINIRPVLHQYIEKWNETKTCCQHKSSCHPVEGTKHPHQDLLLFYVLFRNRIHKGHR